MIATAATAPSAGGSPIDQLMIVSVFTAIAYGALGWVMLAERRGKTTLVGRAADFAANLDGGPRWFALPAGISLLGAFSGAVGVYWDVSYHISEGRDEGPLANPSHYLIFLGLLAIFFGGALGMALATDRLPRRTLRITNAWRTPIGTAAITGIALCALAGFPMDDLWHRIFGQDVTEWGPTHVLMIGGTIMLPYGLLLAAAEAKQVSASKLAPIFTFLSHAVLVVGPVAFLLEYAFGVPQFPLIMDVIVMTIGVTAGLVMASHRGTMYVLAVWFAYVAIQCVLQLANAYAWNAMSPRFPLLLGGVTVAAIAARWARPTALYGAGAGALVGLAVVPVEVFWTNAVRPVEWPDAMLPVAALFATLTGAGVGLVVTWLWAKLDVVGNTEVPVLTASQPAGTPETSTDPAAASTWDRVRTAKISGPAAGVGLLVLVLLFAFNVAPKSGVEGSADITVGAAVNGRAFVDVRVDPDLVEDAYWFHVLSWQGGGMVRSDLVQIEPGLYRSAEPIPVAGNWKSLVRLHKPLHALIAAPIYLPEDKAIPAPAYPAVDGARPFISEHKILQRELKDSVPGWMWTFGYLSVLAVFILLFTVVAAGYAIAGRPGEGTETWRFPKRKTDLEGAV